MKSTILAVTGALLFLAVAAPAPAQLPQGYESVVIYKQTGDPLLITRANGNVGNFAVPFGKQLVITEIDIGFTERPEYVGGRFALSENFLFVPPCLSEMIKDAVTNFVMTTGFTSVGNAPPGIICNGPPGSDLVSTEPDFFIMRGYLRPMPSFSAMSRASSMERIVSGALSEKNKHQEANDSAR